MGATDFSKFYIGTKTPSEAFDELSDQARSEYGSDPYNGTISTTDLTSITELPSGMSPQKYLKAYAEEVDKRECWCVELKRSYLKTAKKRHPEFKGKKGVRAYIFFGLASC